MFKTTVCSLGLAVLCSAVLAEDKDKQSSQSQSQKDSAGAGANSSSGTDAGAASASGAGAGASATADAKTAGAQAQDPTQMFVKEAYNANLFEIQAGQLAGQKAQDDKAKQFARMMVEDHTKANQQLKQIAQSANIQISEQLDPVHQAKLQKMQQIPASEFNRKYINGQVAGHWMNVLEFRHQAQNGQNAQVKQYAAQTLPKLQMHLQHATQMAEEQLGGASAQPAAAHQSGAAKSGGASDAGTSGTSSGSDGSSGQSDSAGQSGTSGQSGQSDTAGQSGAGQSK